MFDFDGIRRLPDLDVTAKRVFVRANLDGPTGGAQRAPESSQIQALATTIQYLLSHEAQVIVGAHRGLPGDETSLEPWAAEVAGALGIEVYLPEDIGGPLSRKLIRELREGRIVFYENLSRFAGEQENDEAFARRLAEGIEVYVGDCVAADGDRSSLRKLARLCPERAIGLNAEQELVAANRLALEHQLPTTVFLGGTFESQSTLLGKLLRPKTTICAGSTLALTLLKAQGNSVGRAQAEEEQLGQARTWLEQARDHQVEVLLPTDARVEVSDAGSSSVEIRDLKQKTLGDIGPQTEQTFVRALEGRRLALLAQPLGTLRTVGGRDGSTVSGAGRQDGSRAVVRALSAQPSSNPLYSVVCSSPELPVIDWLDADELSRIGFVSSAGQGFLDALCGRLLGSVEALRIG